VEQTTYKAEAARLEQLQRLIEGAPDTVALREVAGPACELMRADYPMYGSKVHVWLKRDAHRTRLATITDRFNMAYSGWIASVTGAATEV